MKLLGIGILRHNADTEEPILLSQACELSNFGFFQRGSVKEMVVFFSKTIAKRTPPGQRQSVQNEGTYVRLVVRSCVYDE
jgi:synaptobrevin homolog YKT6